MQNAQEVLQQAITGVLTEKALSKEAIQAVQEILTENENLKAANRLQSEQLKTELNANNILNSENIRLRNEEKAVADREVQVSLREKQADLLNLTVKYEQTRVNDIKEITGLVFRNTTLKKTMYGSENVPVPNGTYIQNQSISKNEEISEV